MSDTEQIDDVEQIAESAQKVINVSSLDSQENQQDKQSDCSNETHNNVDNNEILNQFNNIELSVYEKKSNETEETGKMSFSSSGISAYQAPAENFNNLNNIELAIEKKRSIEYEQDSFLQSNPYKILATLFDTYILIEQGQDFIIIDQHATHERLLYEKLKEKIEDKNFSSHTLMVPYIFDVTPQENETILTVMPSLQELGFEIEEFGYLSFKVNAVPFDDYVSFDCKSFIENILKTNFKSGNLKNNFNDFLATRACKSAVKAGDKLSNEEIEFLINEIKENNTPMFCPHGRPIAIKFEKKDVEKTNDI